MPKVIVYTTNYCGYCRAAKSLLDRRGLAYEEKDVTHSDKERAWLVEVTGARTVPQIFINDQPVGGYEELVRLDRAGGLPKPD